MWRPGIVVLLVTVGLSGPAMAQGPAAYLAPMPPPTHGFASAPVSPLRLRPLARAKGGDRAVAGVLIGGVIGMALGYVLYNGLCEVPSNQCNDSRVRLMVVGFAVGGTIGGIIGSLSGDD